MQPTEAWQRNNGSPKSGVEGTPPLPDDSRINAAVEEYLALLQGEQLPNRAEFLARYPELAPALDECLAALDFLHSAAPQLNQAGAGAAPLAAELRSAAALGDFRIVGEVGRGGMGVVYEAEQISLGRRVALKVLPFASTLDARQLQRFKNEAQAAAHMHHTNIVPVFATGCERGVHFYAMQYIEGQSLAQIIEELQSQLPDRKRQAADPAATGPYLANPPAASSHPPAAQRNPTIVALTTERSIRNTALFRTVARLGIQAAEALEHAHQLGVLHRDIKPANLLIDVRGNLWITDFGLAHCQGGPGLTMTGDLLGTLRYMSPEQALAQRVTVDHRTDIYSLGVTLYELLALEAAFPGRDREEVLRRIAFEEPRLLRRLNQAIPRELETIVLKAMEKNPDDRYATAEELADDLRCWLADKPIRARRPTLLQHARRWGRRHQGLVRAGAVFLVLAVVGLAVSNLLIGRERDRKGEALEGMSREKERADENLARARKAVEDYLSKVTDNPKLKAADFHALRKDLLATAVPFYEEFVKQKQDDPALEADRGRAYMKLAFVREEMGERKQAVADFERARAIFAQLHKDFPSIPTYRQNLAASYNNLGGLLHALGKLAEAETAYRQALATYAQLAADFPTIPEYRHECAKNNNGLGDLLHALGKRAEAETAYRQALAIYQKLAADFPAVPAYREVWGISHYNLGKLIRDLGKLEEAEAAYRQALAIFQKLAADFPTMPDYRRQLAASHVALGGLFRDLLEKRAEAEAAYLKALAIQKQLAADFPAVPDYRQDLAGTHNNLGQVLHELGKLAEAKASLQKALAIKEQLATNFPTVPAYRQELATSQSILGHVLRDLGKWAEAATVHRKALAISKQLASDFPVVPAYRKELAASQDSLAYLFRQMGERDEAVAACQEALTIRTKLAADFPTVPEHREDLAQSHNNVGILLLDLGKHAEALAAFRQALVISEGMVKEFPSALKYQSEFVRFSGNLAALLARLSRYEEAEQLCRRHLNQWPESPDAHNGLAWFLATCPDPKFRKVAEAVTLAKKAVQVAPAVGGYWNTLGVAQYQAGDYQAALEALQKSMQLSNGGDGNDWFFLAMAHWQLGDKEQARKWYDQAVPWLEKNQPQNDELRRFRAEAAELLGIKPAPPSKKKD